LKLNISPGTSQPKAKNKLREAIGNVHEKTPSIKLTNDQGTYDIFDRNTSEGDEKKEKNNKFSDA